MRVFPPDPGLLAGYEEFPARHFFFEYDLTEGCPQPSLRPGGCFLHATLQASGCSGTSGAWAPEFMQG